MKKFFKRITPSVILALAFPLLAAAKDIKDVLIGIKDILNTIIVVLFVFVTLFFIWGIIEYISSSGDEEKLKKGKDHMLWGIIGMAVMAAAWGLVTAVLNYFGLEGGTGRIILPIGF